MDINKQDLDRYITGNWGEDQLRDEPGENDPCGECGHPFANHGDKASGYGECWHGLGVGNRCACREFVQREED